MPSGATISRKGEWAPGATGVAPGGHVLVANEASLALHERAGFRRIGVQEGLGRDGAGRWRDVVLLERRSHEVGR